MSAAAIVRGAAAAWVMPALALAACAPTTRPAGVPATSGAPAGTETPSANRVAVPGTVYIWRGVKTLPNSTHIDWSAASFGVSGTPPTLSFFDTMGNNQPCWLRVPVDAPSVPVQQGQGGTITLTIPPAVPPDPAGLPSPWAATFDNHPAGHWSILKTTIVQTPPASNAAAGRVAGRVFQASTAAGQVTVVDGTTAGCQP